MCTVSIKVNDALLDKARKNMDSNVDIAEWMQQQIEAILIKLALSPEALVQASKRKQDLTQRIISISETDGNSISFCDFEGVLPEIQTSFEDLRDGYISEKYGL